MRTRCGWLARDCEARVRVPPSAQNPAVMRGSEDTIYKQDAPDRRGDGRNRRQRRVGRAVYCGRLLTCWGESLRRFKSSTPRETLKRLIMANTESQRLRILAHLRSGKSITPLEALNLYGCFRLGARIWDLRNEGYDIGMELVKNQNGKRFACYYLQNQ